MLHLDSELSGLFKAVSALSNQENFSLADLERLSSLYRQAAYLFTYIEGNTKFVEADTFFAVKSALLDNTELRGSLASQVRGLMAATNPVPECWTGALEWFLKSPKYIQAEAETRAAMDGVKQVLTRIDRDRAALLARLGLVDGAGGTAEDMVAVLQRVTKPAARSKLLLAWHRAGDAHDDALSAAMDRVVNLRWQHAINMQYRSVAEREFASCGVSANSVRTFLEAYTDHALRERRVFLSRFAGAAALDDGVRALSLVANGREGGARCGPVAINLGALLELLIDTVRRVFGITLSARPGSAGTVAGFDVSKGAETLGTIVLDRAVAGALVLGDDGALAVPEKPRARIFCMMGAGDTVSFEAARQILHAMGHALVYLATRLRLPSASGLDLLPLERLEGLSHWFEELMDDDVFEDRVAVTLEQRAALDAFRRTRDDWARNTRLEQVVVATIDLDIHEQPGCCVRSVYDALIKGMGGPVGVSFERAVRFMTAPLFRDHPGMGFVYPWGAAFGATQTRPAVGEQSPEPSLVGYFDLATAMTVPDLGAKFSTIPHPVCDGAMLRRVLV